MVVPRIHRAAIPRCRIEGLTSCVASPLRSLVATFTLTGIDNAIRHDQAGRCPRSPSQPAPRHGGWRRRFRKPFIAICNSYTDIIPGHVHLNKVGEFVKQCVREAGGVPFVFNTIGVDDGIAMGHSGMKYSLASRELIADCVETMIQRPLLRRHDLHPELRQDRPGHADGRGALQHSDRVRQRRADGGRQDAPDGKKIDLIDVFAGAAAKQTASCRPRTCWPWKRPAARPAARARAVHGQQHELPVRSPGLALPGNGTLLATSAERKRLFRRAAQRIVEMVLQFEEARPGHGLLPREIVTAESVDNSMILDMAMGGSTNTVLHMLAIAHEAGIEYDWSGSTPQPRTPNICRVAPSSHYHVEDVHNSGGISTILGVSIAGAPVC
jgi:dihydroxy-acid dehydratase